LSKFFFGGIIFIFLEDFMKVFFWHFVLCFSLPLKIFCSIDVPTLIEERVKKGGGSAMVVALLEGEGVTTYTFGQLSMEDPEPVDEETLFEIGSISKVFTTLLLQEKVLRGEVGLLDPVERYLPYGFHLPVKNGVPITFRHLATHTSGLPCNPTNHVMQSISNPFGTYTKEKFREFFQEYQLPRLPGESYEYSNTGIGLLGNVLADLEGMDWETLVKSHICFPLGMENTTVHLDPWMQKRLAKGHLGKKIVSNWDLPAFPGAGGLRSCLKDLLIFLKANMGRIDSALYPAMVESHQKICQTDDPDVDVGLGWHITHRFSLDIIWHNGGTGGYRSFFGFCPSNQKGVVILSNSSTKIDDIAFHLLDERYPLEAGKDEILLDPVILKEYVGKYRHRFGLSCFVTQDNKGKLFVQVKGFPDAEALPLSESRFFFKEVAALISFELNSYLERIMVVHYGDQSYVFKRVSEK
jgi:serine-type D-Ala-D-Ala carboxypeptidase/endopeptidase